MEYVYSESLDRVDGEVEIIREWRLELCADWRPLFRVMREGHVYHYKNPATYLQHIEDMGKTVSLSNADVESWTKRARPFLG